MSPRDRAQDPVEDQVQLLADVLCRWLPGTADICRGVWARRCPGVPDDVSVEPGFRVFLFVVSGARRAPPRCLLEAGRSTKTRCERPAGWRCRRWSGTGISGFAGIIGAPKKRKRDGDPTLASTFRRRAPHCVPEARVRRRVLHWLRAASTALRFGSRSADGGRADSPDVPLRPLPRADGGLPALRSRADLLRAGVLATSSPGVAPRSGMPVPDKPRRSLPARGPLAALPAAAPGSDASGFHLRRPG